MDGLYPIIRRVRRPLLPVEAAAEAGPVNVPVAVVTGVVAGAGDSAVVAAEPAAVVAAAAVPEEARSGGARRAQKATHGQKSR
jgi:hypothetical protein